MIPTPFVSLRSTFPPDRGNRPHRPAGGHMGPPLRNFGPFLPVGADLCVRPKRTGRSPPHPSFASQMPPSPEGESSARRGRRALQKASPLVGEVPQCAHWGGRGKRPVCRNGSIYRCPPQSRFARQRPYPFCPFGTFPYPLCRCATSPLDQGSRPPPSLVGAAAFGGPLPSANRGEGGPQGRMRGRPTVRFGRTHRSAPTRIDGPVSP